MHSLVANSLQPPTHVFRCSVVQVRLDQGPSQRVGEGLSNSMSFLSLVADTNNTTVCRSCAWTTRARGKEASHITITNIPWQWLCGDCHGYLYWYLFTLLLVMYRNGTWSKVKCEPLNVLWWVACSWFRDSFLGLGIHVLNFLGFRAWQSVDLWPRDITVHNGIR